jgi:hypothetical protein
MTTKFNRSENSNYELSLAQMELLAALLEPDDACYPWNPADPEAEVYFADREQELLQSDWLEAEMVERSQDFFNQLEHVWHSATPTSEVSPSLQNLSHLQSALRSAFAACLPQNWLDKIAQQATQVAAKEQSIANRLAQCVQDLLPSLAEEDLLVLARPYAYAMRGTEPEIQHLVAQISTQDWNTLSAIEKAKVSLGVARYALTQINNTKSE